MMLTDIEKELILHYIIWLNAGRFNFKPPLEARARKLQKWLSVTASKCFMQKLNSRANKKKRNVT